MTRVLMLLGVLALASVPSSAARAEAQQAPFDRAWNSVVSGGQKSAQAGEWLLEKTKTGGIRALRQAQTAAPGIGQKAKDIEIEAALKEKLAANPATSMHDVDIDVKNGAVTLTGTVRSENEAREDTRIASEIAGVRSVEARLRWPGQAAPRHR